MSVSGERETRRIYRTVASVVVVVEVGNEDAIDRCATPEWKAHMFDLPSREAAVAHLSRQLIYNGTEDAYLLDGWADLKEGEVTFRLDGVLTTDVELLRVEPVEEGGSR